MRVQGFSNRIFLLMVVGALGGGLLTSERLAAQQTHTPFLIPEEALIKVAPLRRLPSGLPTELPAQINLPNANVTIRIFEAYCFTREPVESDSGFVFLAIKLLDCEHRYEPFIRSVESHPHTGVPNTASFPIGALFDFDELVDDSGKIRLRRSEFLARQGKPLVITTESTVKYVVWILPETAGVVDVWRTIVAPPGFKCLAGCIRNDTSLVVFRQGIGILGFQKMPPGANHVVIRGDTDQHPEGDWGWSFTLRGLQAVAKGHADTVKEPLSINDISLVTGGLFDINFDFRRPHKSHRIGIDADLNRRRDAQGEVIPCRSDKGIEDGLKESITEAKIPVKLICEPGGRRHLRFGVSP